MTLGTLGIVISGFDRIRPADGPQREEHDAGYAGGLFSHNDVAHPTLLTRCRVTAARLGAHDSMQLGSVYFCTT